MKLPAAVRKALNLVRDLGHKPAHTRAFPRIFGIETTAHCNAACPFCPLHGPGAAMHRPKGVMEMGLFEKLLDQLNSFRNRLGVVFLNVCGEPLLDPDLVERLRSIGRAGMGEFIDLQTNGQFLRPEYAEAIIDAGLQTVTLGFDGASREVYELHRVNCDYERVLDNMHRFLSLRDSAGGSTKVVVKYVMTRDNQNEVDQARSMWKNHLSAGRDRFVVVPSENWATQRIDQKSSIIKKAASENEQLRPCNMLFDSMNVLFDGRVAACCWDYNLDVFRGPMGDARGDPLIEIWRGAEFEALRSKHRALDFNDLPRCRICSKIRSV